MPAMTKLARIAAELSERAKAGDTLAQQYILRADPQKFTTATPNTFYDPVPSSVRAEEGYKQQAGIDLPRGKRVKRVDVGRAKRIAAEAGYQTRMQDPEMEQKIITPEDLQGKVGIPVASDRSAIRTVDQVGGIDVDPTQVEGGFQYAQQQGGWASGENIASRMQNKANRAAEETGRDPVGVVNTMGERSIDFSTPVSEMILKQVQANPAIPKGLKKSFDQTMRGFHPEWVGIDHPQALDQLAGAEVDGKRLPGKARTTFSQIASKKYFEDRGFPVYQDINEAVTHSSLKDAQIGDTGAAFFDFPAGQELSPAQHKSYSHHFGSEGMGGMERNDIPAEVMFPDVMQSQSQRTTSAGKPLTREQQIDAANKRSDTFQVFDQKWLDGVMNYLQKKQQQGVDPSQALTRLLAAGGVTATGMASADQDPSAQEELAQFQETLREAGINPDPYAQPREGGNQVRPGMKLDLPEWARQAVGTGEVAATVGSAMATDSVAGLSGMGTAMLDNLADDLERQGATYLAAKIRPGSSARDVVEGLQNAADAGIYIPKTQEGLSQLQSFGETMGEIGTWLSQHGGKEVMDTFKDTQESIFQNVSKVNPELGAAAATAFRLIPEAL